MSIFSASELIGAKLSNNNLYVENDLPRSPNLLSPGVFFRYAVQRPSTAGPVHAILLIGVVIFKNFDVLPLILVSFDAIRKRFG